METPILIENLEKTYKGGFKAVDALTLSVPRRSFVGFLGPNGAGKTTTIKIMTHLLEATGGKVYLNGVDAMSDPKKAMAEVGAVVETPEFYPYLTPVETLEYLGRLRGMSRQDIRRRTGEVLETVKMTEVKDKRIGQFSKGMKQRIAIAQAIMHEPSMIILDEPTSGLDPRGMFEVREVLNDLKKEDYTIFMSSHLLNEVQETCTDVALINRGKLLRYGKVADLIKEARAKKMEVKVARQPEQGVYSRITSLSGVMNLQVQGLNEFTFDIEGGDDEQAQLLVELQSLGLRVVSYKESGLALESLYMSLIADSR
ncbi:MAG: Trehalose/maltose import ATP-binding protein MalK [Methanomassiliicoccales archaeon PtaU1.Bin124]|nr:MAG: Trehalose/maltose import ATP-binding protein MalK [Methanomassiliicoccales archaeon PtaU1.Bin124]